MGALRLHRRADLERVGDQRQRALHLERPPGAARRDRRAVSRRNGRCTGSCRCPRRASGAAARSCPGGGRGGARAPRRWCPCSRTAGRRCSPPARSERTCGPASLNRLRSSVSGSESAVITGWRWSRNGFSVRITSLMSWPRPGERGAVAVEHRAQVGPELVVLDVEEVVELGGLERLLERDRVAGLEASPSCGPASARCTSAPAPSAGGSAAGCRPAAARPACRA